MNEQSRKMSDPKDTWSITDLATEFDITARTIRFYEDKGLLSPKREGQTRVYNRHDRTKLKLVLRCKRLGFSLDDVQDLLDLMYDPPLNSRFYLEQASYKVGNRIAQLEEQQRDIQETLADLTSSQGLINRLLDGEVVDFKDTPFADVRTGKVVLAANDKVEIVS